jgi:ATP-binding cassette, subfamily F, member 3
MIILDEPTNHLDVDAREALAQALNDYGGAVVIVSHDRHLLELTADRLVLVADGTATEFSGTLDDYREWVLRGGEGSAEAGTDPDDGAAKRVSKKDQRRAAAEAREQSQALRKAVKQAETEIAKLTAQRSEIDRALFDPKNYDGPHKTATMSELMKLRANIEKKLAAAEARWLDACEALERTEAGLAEAR